MFVITGFPELETDSEGRFTDGSIQEKYGNLAAEPGMSLDDLGLPEDLKVTGYLESEGSDTASETTLSQMVWKLKSDTGELYTENSPEGTYTFVPDFEKYLESGSISYDEIRLADGVRTPSIKVTVAAAQTDAPATEYTENTETDTPASEYTENTEADTPASEYIENTETDTPTTEYTENTETDDPASEYTENTETDDPASEYTENTETEAQSQPDYINSTDDSLINAEGAVVINGETEPVSETTESDSTPETEPVSETAESDSNNASSNDTLLITEPSDDTVGTPDTTNTSETTEATEAVSYTHSTLPTSDQV